MLLLTVVLELIPNIQINRQLKSFKIWLANQIDQLENLFKSNNFTTTLRDEISQVVNATEKSTTKHKGGYYVISRKSHTALLKCVKFCYSYNNINDTDHELVASYLELYEEGEVKLFK